MSKKTVWLLGNNEEGGPSSLVKNLLGKIPELERSRREKGERPLINLSFDHSHLPANSIVMKQLEYLETHEIDQKYSPVLGSEATRNAIVELYQHYYPKICYESNEVMVTLGATGAFANIFGLFAEKEEDVFLAFEPYSPAYVTGVQIYGGSLEKIATLQDDFRPSAAALDKSLAHYPQAKAVIFNYPNNPSGICLTVPEATEIGEVLKKYPDVLIIIDDSYRDLNYQSHVTVLDIAPELKNRCIVINSGSKGLLGAPSERIGMVGAPQDLIARMTVIQANTILNVPYRTQLAVQIAIKNYLTVSPNAWLANARRVYQHHVLLACRELKKIGFNEVIVPEGGYYLLINAMRLIDRKDPQTRVVLKNDIDIADYFLHKAGVVMLPCVEFGIATSHGYLRMTCAIEQELLLEAIKCLGDAIGALIEKGPHPQYVVGEPAVPPADALSSGLFGEHTHADMINDMEIATTAPKLTQ